MFLFNVKNLKYMIRKVEKIFMNVRLSVEMFVFVLIERVYVLVYIL